MSSILYLIFVCAQCENFLLKYYNISKFQIISVFSLIKRDFIIEKQLARQELCLSTPLSIYQLNSRIPANHDKGEGFYQS